MQSTTYTPHIRGELYIEDTLPNPQFGRNVRRYRQQAGLTQEKLGELSELDRGYISGVERGVRNPTVVSVERLAAALGIQAGQLFESVPIHDGSVEHTTIAGGHTARH